MLNVNPNVHWYIQIIYLHKKYFFFSVQFWVCLQLPLVGQPKGQLGWGEEGGHDGTAARGPQVCHSPGRPQGKSLVSFIRRTQIASHAPSHVMSSAVKWILIYLRTLCRRSRGRTLSACHTPQPQQQCMLTGQSGWSQKCCSLGLDRVKTQFIQSVMLDTFLYNISWKHLLPFWCFFFSLWVPSDQLWKVSREELHVRLRPGSQPFHTR